MHQIIIFPPYVLLAERSKPSTYTPICNIIRYCVAFSTVCIKPCVSNWRTESICWLHLMTGMKFKIGEQIWWQRMSAYVSRRRRNADCPERHGGVISVPDSNSLWFDQVRAGKCNLSADRFTALLAQSHLLISRRISREEEEKGITGKGLMDLLSVSLLF